MGLAALSLCLASCAGGDAEAPPATAAVKPVQAAPAPADVLAWVNGKPITELDVRTGLDKGVTLTVESRRNLLDVLIDKELKADQAREQGLDQEPSFRAKIRPLQARVDATARAELADAWYRSRVVDQAKVDEADIQAYFAANEPRIRTELHLEQILLRKRDAIDAARAALKAGKDFDEVAAEQMPTPQAAAQRPWDLGFLQWGQVPEAWGPVLETLQPGQTSDVIEGPGSRFWLVRLVEQRKNDTASFQDYRPFIQTVLEREKTASLTRDLDQHLRDGAKIRYVDPPPPLAPPPAEEEE